MKVDVALVANRAYLGPLIVTAASVLKTARADSDVTIHLFLEGVSENDVDETKRELLSIRDCHIIWHAFDMQKLDDMGLASWRGSAGTKNVWVRTFFAELLPDVDWLVYLDCDILCMRPLETLVEQRDESCAVIAVPDESPVMRKKETKWAQDKCGISIPQEEYFNAGVLLFNLKMLRDMHFVNMVGEFVSKFGCPYALDQTTLNTLLYGKIKLVDDCYNRAQGQLGLKGYKDHPVIHYCCGVPWNKSPFIPMSQRLCLWWRFWDSIKAGRPIVVALQLPFSIRVWKSYFAYALRNRILCALLTPFMNKLLKMKGYSLMNEVHRFWVETDVACSDETYKQCFG